MQVNTDRLDKAIILYLLIYTINASKASKYQYFLFGTDLVIYSTNDFDYDYYEIRKNP